MYATFGWWFVTPRITPTGLIGYGGWALAPASDYLTNWVLTQYSLLLYYSWIVSTLYQIIICRKPAYDQIIIRGIRYHNNIVSFFFVFMVHFFDFFFLMRSGQDFLFGFSSDYLCMKMFLVFHILDMNYFMYASALIIWQDYTDQNKLFGTYQVRNVRARNRQLREAVVLNSFISVITITMLSYCIAPELWLDKAPLNIWVANIYRMPYFNMNTMDGYIDGLRYGSMSDYSPRGYYPNCVRGEKKLMFWVTGEDITKKKFYKL